MVRSALVSLQNDDSFPEEEREAIRWLTETWLSVKRDSDSRDPSPDSSVGLATPRPSRFLDQMSAFPSWTDLRGESTSHPMRIDEDDEDDCATDSRSLPGVVSDPSNPRPYPSCERKLTADAMQNPPLCVTVLKERVPFISKSYHRKFIF